MIGPCTLAVDGGAVPTELYAHIASQQYIPQRTTHQAPAAPPCRCAHHGPVLCQATYRSPVSPSVFAVPSPCACPSPERHRRILPTASPHTPRTPLRRTHRANTGEASPANVSSASRIKGAACERTAPQRHPFPSTARPRSALEWGLSQRCPISAHASNRQITDASGQRAWAPLVSLASAAAHPFKGAPSMDCPAACPSAAAGSAAASARALATTPTPSTTWSSATRPNGASRPTSRGASGPR